MRYLSTFSGIGGFEIGIEKAYELSQSLDGQPVGAMGHDRDSPNSDNGVRHGGRSRPVCIGYSEVDQYAIKTYEEHYEHHNYGDITTIDAATLPDFDLIVGGFPCQAFSVAGKRKGFDETRGTLFFDLARILKHKRPGHFVFENVKGLLSHDSGKTIQTIARVLADTGYRIEWQVLNSKDFGVPQNRERIYIVGHLRGICTGQVFPIFGQDGEDTGSVSQDSRIAGTINRGAFKTTGESMATLTADARIRRLTPVECERLQGFPDNWTIGSDTQRYKQCGNAVTTNVVEAVMLRLKECL